MGQGWRPGRLLAKPDEELASLAAPAEAAPDEVAGGSLHLTVVDLIRQHDIPALGNALRQALHRQGLQQFVLETVSALNRAIGEAYFRRGNLLGAVEQLQLAVKAKDGDFYEFSSAESRLREMRVAFRTRPLMPGEKSEKREKEDDRDDPPEKPLPAPRAW